MCYGGIAGLGGFWFHYIISVFIVSILFTVYVRCEESTFTDNRNIIF